MGIYYYARQLTDIKGRIEVFEKYLNGLPHTSNDNKLKLDKIDDINFKNICFSYNKKPVLKNIRKIIS